MKTIIFKSSILFFIVALSMISYNGYSQKSRLTRQEQKEKMNADLITNFKVLDTLLEMKRFVFEANYTYGSYGERNVKSWTNFIKVDSCKVVIQPTSVPFSLNYIGIKDISNAEGSIQDWKLIKDEKALRYKLSFSTSSIIENFDITMRITAENLVTATITGSLTGTRTYLGNIQTIYNSAIYQYPARY
jgi:hypothetical protein